MEEERQQLRDPLTRGLESSSYGSGGVLEAAAVAAAEPTLLGFRSRQQLEWNRALFEGRGTTHWSHQQHKRPLHSSWRIVDRDAPFGQSFGRLHINRMNRSQALYRADWFHTVVNSSNWIVLVVFLALYCAAVVVFAVMFMTISKPCALDLDTFQEAYAFSLETFMTIGFEFPANGADHDFVHSCPALFVIITLESAIGVIVNAICVGLVFSRFSRAQTRASTIIFSKNAVVRRVNGRLKFMFNVVEMRKHTLVEAHVRCYAVSRHEIADSSFCFVRTDAMRLIKPDDELGSTIFMGLPSLIVHDIDGYSPLHKQEDSGSTGLLRRECDNTAEEDAQTASSMREYPDDYRKDDALFENYMKERRVEILCLVEGIDSVTSDTIQARHSYVWEDICMHHDFVPSVLEDTSGALSLDYEQFHKTFPVPEELKDSPPMYLFSAS